MDDCYFFDTYALVEVIKGNKNYEPFKKAKVIISILNVIELHYILLRDFNQEIAEMVVKKYVKYIVPFTLRTVIGANTFKIEYKKEKLSMVDVIGYVLAKELNIKFLTGDEKFRTKENVAFVKME